MSFDFPTGTNIVPYRPKLPENNESKHKRLKAQLAKLEADERETERKKHIINEIADMREKIKSRGEIPCA
jgi:hypothetical protein